MLARSGSAQPETLAYSACLETTALCQVPQFPPWLHRVPLKFSLHIPAGDIMSGEYVPALLRSRPVFQEAYILTPCDCGRAHLRPWMRTLDRSPCRGSCFPI